MLLSFENVVPKEMNGQKIKCKDMVEYFKVRQGLFGGWGDSVSCCLNVERKLTQTALMEDEVAAHAGSGHSWEKLTTLCIR